MNRPGEVVYAGKLFSVRRQPVRQADGSESMYEIVDHPDAAASVAIREDTSAGGPAGRYMVALVHQYRPAVGKVTLELPAGLLHSDEVGVPEQTAARELAEETGWTAGTWQLLVRAYPSSGFSTESVWIYLATELEEIPGAIPDPHEILRVEWMPVHQALDGCRDGTIDDAKTIIGLCLAAAAMGLDSAH